MKWTARIKSAALRTGTALLLCEPENNPCGRKGELAPRDTITFMPSAGGSMALTVARASKNEIVLHNADGTTWRLSPTLPNESKSGLIHSGPSSDWTVRARSA
jgi:hypothetical protein